MNRHPGDREAFIRTANGELFVCDESTSKAALELLRPILDYNSIEQQHVQPAQEGSTPPDNPDGTHTDDNGLESNLAIQTDYALDHENPYHLQWAYEQSDCSIGQASEYFDVSKTVVRDNLTEAGIHDPEEVNGPAEYREKETLEEAFERNNRDIEDTADEFGVSTKTVRNWLSRHGIDTDPPWQDEERLRAVFTDCKEVVEWTADEFDASPSTIRRWLRRFDVLDGKEPSEVAPEELEEVIGNGNLESKDDDSVTESETVTCEYEDGEGDVCGREFDSERAKNIHKTRTHGKDDEENDPAPVEPPEDDELSEEGYDIDEDAIRSVDILEYGEPYTTGNLAETLADCSSFDEIGVKLDISEGEAQRLCTRIGISEIFATGQDIDLEEIRARLKIAVEKPDSKNKDSKEEFWCGYCGVGPKPEFGIYHHHHEEHEGEPLIWDVEPSDEDLADDGAVDDEDGPDSSVSIADGGSAAVGGTGSNRTCQNCGSHVTAQYTRVFAPDEGAGPRACPNCEDMVRDRDGVRPKRNSPGESR